MIIKSSVPQASILGPILFLLYINDIEHCSKLISFILFADDTNIFYSNKCLKTLNKIMQTEIDKVAEWLNANKLSLNTTKTKVILFRSSNKKPKKDIKININGNNIEQVRNTVFLGIVIGECLTWKDHIAKVANKLIRAAGIIAKIRYIVNRNTVKLIYYASQKKIVRLMAFKSYFDHSEPIFKDLNILNIFKINDYLTALFMFRYHHLNNLPEFFKDYFVTNNQIHQYNTRNASKLHKCYKRTNYVEHTLSNKGVDVWNSLETKFIDINFYSTFKKQIKQHFLLYNV